MKKFISLFIAVFFVFAMATTYVSAYPPAAEKPAEAEKKATVKQITGEVVAIDAAAKTITIKGKKAELLLSADEKMLKDIKVGDKVVAKYEEKEGKMIAKSLKKAEAKAEQKADEIKPEAAKPTEPAKKKKAIEGC